MAAVIHGLTQCERQWEWEQKLKEKKVPKEKGKEKMKRLAREIVDAAKQATAK